MAIMTGTEILLQQKFAEGGIIKPNYDYDYDCMAELQCLRRKSEYYQDLMRKTSGVVTVLTSISRYNRKLLLCQP